MNAHAPKPRGFTLTELLIVSGLMAFMAMMLSSAWHGLGRSAIDLVARAQIVQEMELAIAALSRDLGGSLGDPEGRAGGKSDAKWINWSAPGNNKLLLYFDNGEEADIFVQYALEDKTDPDATTRLVRTSSAAPAFTVANLVDSLAVTPEGDDVKIVLTFKLRNVTRVCTLIAKQP